MGAGERVGMGAFKGEPGGVSRGFGNIPNFSFEASTLPKPPPTPVLHCSPGRSGQRGRCSEPGLALLHLRAVVTCTIVHGSFSAPEMIRPDKQKRIEPPFILSDKLDRELAGNRATRN